MWMVVAAALAFVIPMPLDKFLDKDETLEKEKAVGGVWLTKDGFAAPVAPGVSQELRAPNAAAALETTHPIPRDPNGKVVDQNSPPDEVAAPSQ